MTFLLTESGPSPVSRPEAVNRKKTADTDMAKLGVRSHLTEGAMMPKVA
jgi:hypothetical protein